MENQSHLDSMLDQAQAVLSCPVCQRRFDRGELRLRGMFERHGIIQASCSDKHNPTVVIFIADEHGGKRTASEQPLTKQDVFELHQTLQTFDGNFRKYLKPNRPNRSHP